jgi:hypothetical protein
MMTVAMLGGIQTMPRKFHRKLLFNRLRANRPKSKLKFKRFLR